MKMTTMTRTMAMLAGAANLATVAAPAAGAAAPGVSWGGGGSPHTPPLKAAFALGGKKNRTGKRGVYRLRGNLDKKTTET